MEVASRAPALALLAVVILAAALLVAGLGVAVGVGVLVGLILGLSVAAMVVLRTPRGGVVSGGWMRTSSAPDLELLGRQGREWMRVSSLETSALRRVIAGGMATEVAGIRLELIAIELREDGGVAILVSRARPPAVIGHMLEVAVSDDVGTTYTGAGQSQGGPSPAVARVELRFAPAPPAGARRLTLRIDAFLDPFPAPARRLVGPWSLEVDLTPER